METNNRHNRRRYDQDHLGNDSRHYRRVDEDVYRGAYRFDNESDHRNETTYDGFDLNDSMAQNRDDDKSHYRNSDRYRYENNQGGDYIYRRSLNTQDNDRSYSRQHDRDRDYNRRNESDDRDRNRNAQYEQRNRFGQRDGWSNFDNNYGPDTYRSQHRDQNYGNMAGSLSFGYDGDNNSDPDYRRRYDPASGDIRRERDSDNRGRRSGRYGPPDRYGFNPDYDNY